MVDEAVWWLWPADVNVDASSGQHTALPSPHLVTSGGGRPVDSRSVVQGMETARQERQPISVAFPQKSQHAYATEDSNLRWFEPGAAIARRSCQEAHLPVP